VAVAYEIVTHDRAGREHVRRYTSEESLVPGSVVVLADRPWLVQRVEQARVDVRPARYRLALRYPDGREEVGALRRFHVDAPTLGHQLTTLDGGAPISWTVVEQQLAYDDAGEPLLELIAERDYDEADALPDHELEHALARNGDDADTAVAVLARADAERLAVELVALEPGEAPDWEEAGRFLDALVLEEVNDDLLERCAVDPANDPRDTWLETVRQRLRDDLDSFRADIEGDHDQIEEWDFRGGRTFAAVGSLDDEANPLHGYGWMGRLVDAGVLAAAGFERIRKASLQP
jgi:hypothetical protein